MAKIDCLPASDLEQIKQISREIFAAEDTRNKSSQNENLRTRISFELLHIFSKLENIPGLKDIKKSYINFKLNEKRSTNILTEAKEMAKQPPTRKQLENQ